MTGQDRTSKPPPHQESRALSVNLIFTQFKFVCLKTWLVTIVCRLQNRKGPNVWKCLGYMCHLNFKALAWHSSLVSLDPLREVSEYSYVACSLTPFQTAALREQLWRWVKILLYTVALQKEMSFLWSWQLRPNVICRKYALRFLRVTIIKSYTHVVPKIYRRPIGRYLD